MLSDLVVAHLPSASLCPAQPFGPLRRWTLGRSRSRAAGCVCPPLSGGTLSVRSAGPVAQPRAALSTAASAAASAAGRTVTASAEFAPRLGESLSIAGQSPDATPRATLTKSTTHQPHYSKTSHL